VLDRNPEIPLLSLTSLLSNSVPFCMESDIIQIGMISSHLADERVDKMVEKLEF